MSAEAIAVDGGQSGCRVALVVDGEIVARGAGPPTPSASRPDGPARAADAIAAALADAGVSGSDRLLAAGLTGLGEDPAAAGAVVAALRSRLGVGRVRLAGDLVTAYVGALGAAPGVVVAGGTGAVALAVADAERRVRVDGWGYLLGDDGSGFAIGRAGLRAACAHVDGRGGSAALAERAVQRYGPLGELPARLHAASDPAGLMAQFVPDVADAAAAGDRVARTQLTDAAAALAHTAATAARRAFGQEAVPVVAWTGGLFALDLLREAFGDAVAQRLPETVVTPPHGTALDGAVALAMGNELAMSLVAHDG